MYANRHFFKGNMNMDKYAEKIFNITNHERNAY